MEMGKTYYIVRWGVEFYAWERGDEGDRQLLVFADYKQAREKARRVGSGTIVEPMSDSKAADIARNLGYRHVLIVEEDGSRVVVSVESLSR